MIGINHRFTTSYHAQSNGVVERYNRTLKAQLRCISADKPSLDIKRTWDLYIPLLNCVHNNKLGRRTNYKMCPNEIFIGRRLRTPLNFKLCENGRHAIGRKKGGEYFIHWLQNMHKINNNIADRELQKYNAQRLEYANRHRKSPA
eukprot:1127371_1